MNLRQREIAKNKSQPVAKMLADTLNNRMCAATMRTFVVAVLDQRHGRGLWPCLMVGRSDRNPERGHCSPVARVFQGFENAVSARVDGERRDIAPGDPASGVDHEQCTLADPVGRT